MATSARNRPSISLFVEQLRKRNVYRAAVAYAMVAWLLTQVATQVFPFFEIPNAAVRLVIIALLVGFPIAMLLAWLYDFTPEGLVRTEELTAAQAKSAQRVTGRILDFVIIGVLLVVLIVVAIERRPFAAGAADNPAKSIAVLPFENASEQKTNGYFADGVQDELLTDLSRIPELKVISRTSVEQYRNVRNRNLRDVAQQLGVGFVVEGRVQREGDRVRISAQLINARNDAHVWAEHYDRQVADVFAIQSDIAEKIAQQLHTRISGETKGAIEQKPTNDLVAYDLYLQGSQLYRNIGTSKDWEGDNRKAIAFLERAVERDPNFAPAYCLLSDLHLNLYIWVDHTSTRREHAKAALDQAIRLAPDAGETYMERGEFEMAVNHDAPVALEMLNRAAQLLASDARVMRTLADVQQRRGLWKEALRSFEKAARLDPRGPNTPNNLKELYFGLRQYAKCDQLCDKAIAEFPDGPGYFLAMKVEIALARGDTKLARQKLAAIPQEWDPTRYRSYLMLKIAIAERSYTEFSQTLASVRREEFGPGLASVAFMDALVARTQGESGRSESVIGPVREAAAKNIAAEAPDSVDWSRLARADAYLGRTQDALREAEKAVELTPISLDAVNGPDLITALAEVCMLAHDSDRAIELLSQVVGVPFGPSYGELLMPFWDPLRDDPRFQQLATKASAAVELSGN